MIEIKALSQFKGQGFLIFGGFVTGLITASSLKTLNSVNS